MIIDAIRYNITAYDSWLIKSAVNKVTIAMDWNPIGYLNLRYPLIRINSKYNVGKLSCT